MDEFIALRDDVYGAFANLAVDHPDAARLEEPGVMPALDAFPDSEFVRREADDVSIGILELY